MPTSISLPHRQDEADACVATSLPLSLSEREGFSPLLLLCAALQAAADAAGPALAAVIGQAFSTFSLGTIFGGLKISFWHARPCFSSKLL